MPKGMDSLFSLIGEAVWNKLGKQNPAAAPKDSTAAPVAPPPASEFEAMMTQHEAQMAQQGMMRDWGQPPLPGATGQAQVPDYVKASMYGNAYKGY